MLLGPKHTVIYSSCLWKRSQVLRVISRLLYSVTEAQLRVCAWGWETAGCPAHCTHGTSRWQLGAGETESLSHIQVVWQRIQGGQGTIIQIAYDPSHMDTRNIQTRLSVLCWCWAPSSGNGPIFALHDGQLVREAGESRSRTHHGGNGSPLWEHAGETLTVSK